MREVSIFIIPVVGIILNWYMHHYKPLKLLNIWKHFVIGDNSHIATSHIDLMVGRWEGITPLVLSI
jgi:predicted class III extradiol MEMO1 family dioxygenase